jgi:hypothetical protein
MVAVIAHVPAEVALRVLFDTEHPADPTSSTTYETDPPVVPPLVVRVRPIPYVPEVLVIVSATWSAGSIQKD